MGSGKVAGGLSIVLGLALSLVSAAFATPGDLDPAFGAGGIVKTNIGWGGNTSYGRAIVQQADGKILMGGSGWDADTAFGLMRFDVDGTIDASFGDRGRVITRVGAPWSGSPLIPNEVVGVVEQSDGKLVAAGRAFTTGMFGVGADFALARYDHDGSLDPTFGAGGIVRIPVSTYDFATAVVLQPDGKLVVAGYGLDDHGFGVLLARVDANGVIDASFGVGGIARLDLGGDEYAYALALQSDGKLVIAGNADPSPRKILLARFQPNGILDAGFGNAGVTTIVLGGPLDEGFAVLQQPDGRLVVAGHRADNTTSTIALLRYQSNGTLDPGFGAGGIVTTTVEPYAIAYGITRQPDGRLVVVGSSNGGAVVARYDVGGSLDATFGTGGIVVASVAGPYESRAVIVEGDGRIVAGGSAFPFYDAFAVVRYQSDGSLDPTFGTSGTVVASAASSRDSSTSMVVQPDGKVVAAGWSWGEGPYRFALVRYETDGSLDAGFGDGGRAVTLLPDAHMVATGIVQQSTGRLVVGGTRSPTGPTAEFVLARYDTNGTLDPTFGTGGIVITTIGDDNANATALIQQSDGKLVQVGYAISGGNTVPALVRYNSDGTLDGGFGSGGILLAPNVPAQTLLQQTDGKLVVAGAASLNFAVARFSGGALDPSFGSGGIAYAGAPEAAFQSFTAIVQQADAKLVAVGDVVVARFTTAGASDSSFSGDGVAVGPIAHQAVAQQGDGKLVAAGKEHPFGPGQIALARYTAAGALDGTFGSGGQVVTMLGGSSSAALAMRLLPDTKVVVAGEADSDFALARYFTQNCGNGTLDAGESCDDGDANGSSVSCCSTACTYKVAGTACTGGACNGSGICIVPTTTTSSTSTSTTTSSTSSSTTSSSTTTSSLSTTSSSTSTTSSSSTSSTASTSSSSTSTSSSSTTSTSTTATTTTLACPDADADGVCDADDPCTNVAGARTATKASVKAARLLPPGGDDVLRIAGIITVPITPPIDPVAKGVRVLYGDQAGAIFDTIVPPGTYDPIARVGWTARGTSFKYVDRSGASHLIEFSLKANASVPGQFKVTVKGRHGTYAGGALPFRAAVVLDHPTAVGGQCGEWLFPAVRPATPSCVLNGIGSVVKCR